MPRAAVFDDGNSRFECEIKRRGTRNTRIIFDGKERLVPTSFVTVVPEVQRNLGELIIPKTPLEMLYRKLRLDIGGKQAQFDSIVDRLENRHGATGGYFLSELFRRSCVHSGLYRNLEETFHPERSTGIKKGQKFAADLVSKWNDSVDVSLFDTLLTYVDYEIYPFRTTESCTERGKSGKATASGGMDLLLASQANGKTLPAIGEVKAESETVGPTFALIQGLMYASQIATLNQFKRLEKHYPSQFKGVGEFARPEVEVVLLLEEGSTYADGDMDFLHKTIDELKALVKDYDEVGISEIRVLECSIQNESIKVSQNNGSL